MHSTNKQFREQLRLLHILASFILGLFIYSPWRSNQTVLISMGFAGFPILALTSLWLWQGTRIQKCLKQRPTSLAN